MSSGKADAGHTSCTSRRNVSLQSRCLTAHLLASSTHRLLHGVTKVSCIGPEYNSTYEHLQQYYVTETEMATSKDSRWQKASTRQTGLLQK